MNPCGKNVFQEPSNSDFRIIDSFLAGTGIKTDYSLVALQNSSFDFAFVEIQVEIVCKPIFYYTTTK